MKLPLKYIAILVILSLAGIFSYQAYWLGGLYRTMRNDLERNIIEAMRMSDYNEMMLRVERMRKDSADHGTVSVSAGFEKDGTQNKTYVHSTTSIDRNGRKEETSDQQVIHQKSDTLLMSISDNSSVQAIITRDGIAVPDSDDVLFIERNKDRNKAQWLNADSAQKKLEAAVKDTGNPPQAALRANSGLDVILRDQNSMLELATYLQRGLHSGLDVISDPDALYTTACSPFSSKTGASRCPIAWSISIQTTKHLPIRLQTRLPWPVLPDTFQAPKPSYTSTLSTSVPIRATAFGWNPLPRWC